MEDAPGGPEAETREAGADEELAGDPAPEATSAETALAWLASVRAPALLAVLREPEFAHVSVSAFAGFRVNPTGYANPLVRRRLAQEITQNDKFADKIRALAEQAQDRAPAPNPGGVGSPPAPDAPDRPPAPNSGGVREVQGRREEELRADRDRRRRERDEARDTLRSSEQARTQAEKSLAVAEQARDAQGQLAQQQAQRIARLERQIARMHAEQASLLKALRQDKVSPPPRATGHLHSSPPPPELGAGGRSGAGGPDLWHEAVSRLLHKGRHDTALTLALDVLRADPEEVSALEIAGLAWERKGETREAAGAARHLLAVRLARGETAAAADVLIRLLLLVPACGDARRDARQWLAHLRADDGEAMAAGRAALGRLRGLSPAAHAWLAAEIAAAAPALAGALMPPPGALGPDDPLPPPFPQWDKWTAQRLVHAVNTGAEGAVATARETLAALAAADPETAGRVWAALTRAAESDDSALAPLRRAPRGPVVVDGSNVAWFDQHSYATPRARLASILGLRRALRRRGFFPVVLLADAPLPYTIDDPAALRALLGRGEIFLVDGGTDADEVLLREAKLRQAPLVTNDYMTDWDPHNEVEKIQFTVSLSGEAHLLS